MLNTEELDFIAKNAGKDSKSLILKKDKYKNINISLCVNCIEAREKIRNKVPYWYKYDKIVYPISLSIEQCSSQACALYKQKIILELFNNTQKDNNESNKALNIADLTGGLGIDSFFISLNANKLYYFERNNVLLKAAKYNFNVLNANNIEVYEPLDELLSINSLCTESIEQLKTKKIDCIYIDPARRGNNESKLIKLEDYEPNVLEIRDSLLKIAKYLIIKVSPMADIKLYISLLKNVKAVHIVSVDNDCKELIFVLSKDLLNEEIQKDEVLIYTQNLSLNKIGTLELNNQSFCFSYKQEQNANVELTNCALKYLYEPNKSLLKAAAFKLISEKYNVKKFDKDTHLYTSDNLVSFPGKVYEVIKQLDFSKNNIKTIAKEYPLASITARNLPIDTNEFRKISKIKEGGEYHIFAFGAIGGKRLILICKRSLLTSLNSLTS